MVVDPMWVLFCPDTRNDLTSLAGVLSLARLQRKNKSFIRISVRYHVSFVVSHHSSASIDPKLFNDARAGIPVTTQRRFDVYSDVSKDM